MPTKSKIAGIGIMSREENNMENQKYGVGDMVILDDGELAVITMVYQEDDDYYYEVETRGKHKLQITFEVAQNDIQGMA